ncbi:MAG: MFS transporter [Kofleriaceae bacterium]|nr:MFS transporter [Myxococcales bacterium]MCB9563696.1 MFS transporter [Kofleriaceae bacterium]MCB9571145.1 MFS transporter [Kofleriaceae bacterium]
MPPRLRSRLAEWAELDHRVWRMAGARAVNTMGMSLVMSFLGIYVVESRGYPAWLYGVCALAANLAQSMASAWAGELSDRIGRRPLITGSLVVRAFVISVLGLQVLLDAPLWALAINFAASSALRGGFEPVAYALVADVCRPDQRIAAFGLQRMGTNLGWAMGPAIGGLLTVWLPYGAVFFITGAALLAAAWTTTGVPESRAAAAGGGDRVALGDAFREAWRNPPLLALLAATFLFALVHTQLFSTFSIYWADVMGLPKASIGLLYTINGVGVLLFQVPAIGLIRRIGVRRAMIGAAAVYVVAYLTMGAARGFAGAAIAVAVITMAEIVFSPAHQTAAAESGDPSRRGRTFGVVGFAQILGVAFAPLYGGTLLDQLGHHPLLMWGGVAVMAVLLTATTSIYAALQQRESRATGSQLG